MFRLIDINFEKLIKFQSKLSLSKKRMPDAYSNGKSKTLTLKYGNRGKKGQSRSREHD